MSPRRTSDDWYEHRPRRPGPSAPRPGGRKSFGVSWWGRAWADALEERAQLDPNRLPRGRTYARSGAVGPLTLVPGRIEAQVQGSRRAPYRVQVRVREFTDSEWGRLLDALAAEIGHTASLLDGELPAGVADDVRSVGLELLPGPGELQPRCSCPDWADPCKHSAAVCYLVADALDADPFGVLLLRGRGRDEVLAALRARRRAGPYEAAGLPAGSGPEADPGADEGVPARAAWARTPKALPAAPALPQRPGHPAVLAADPPPGTGVDADVLRALAADAAGRALALLWGAPSTGLELTPDEDLARRAAGLLGGDDEDARPRADALASLARRAGLSGRSLLHRALAYRSGGVEGLAVLVGDWDPPPGALEAGRALLGPEATARRNRVTLAGRQLRLGRDGRLHPYRKDGPGRWCPDGDPVTPLGGDEVGSLDDEADAG